MQTWRCLPQEIWSSGGMLRVRGRGGVRLKRSGAREACCGPGDVASKEVWRCAAGVLPLRGVEPRTEAHCRRRDVEVFVSRDRELGRCGVGVQTWRYGGSEFWRCAASVLPLCLKSSGDALQVCICGGVGMEIWRRAAGVGTCRSLPQEFWRCAVGVASICLFASRALEACCRRCLKRGMELLRIVCCC